jgi:glutamyl-Q tRNA(Asp) synthetase
VRLRDRGLTFQCSCSRREIADVVGDGPVIYPGTCRGGPRNPEAPCAVRLRVKAGTIEFDDGLQGHCVQDLQADVGDFVLRRRDGLFAYQLAVVVDDSDQGVTEVVRGTDLIDSTPRQILLQRLLGLATPAYLHLPVVVTEGGEKLGKQTGAEPISDAPPAPTLIAALRFLGQEPPAALAAANPVDVLEWAREHWNPAPLRGRRTGTRGKREPLDAAQ